MANTSNEMPFFEHLEVLRWHLIRSIAALLVFTIAAFIGKSFIFDTIIFGPKNPNFWTYRMLCQLSDSLGLGNSLCLKPINFEVMNMQMAGQFSAHIQVSVLVGVVLTIPYFLWEIWRFIEPALYEKEQKYTRRIVFYSSILFLIGVLFGYYMMVPFSMNFLVDYQTSQFIANKVALDSYISFLSTLVLASGIVFEMPIAVYFLTKVGLVTPADMREYRRHALLAIVVIAAVITPPDVMSQMLVAVPMYFLYEASIWVSAAVLKTSSVETDLVESNELVSEK
ncbi:MAG: twin-arginine translocase subunit TatC [Chitinophagales bacterium]|jgi:sec-independent protein translocase protein TatC|nr:twin-arginine translocase subunit TatC [Chitinophagales bacterium]